MRVQIEAECRALDALAQISGPVGFGERVLEALVHVPNLAVDVVVADGDSHRVSCDRHAFDDGVRVVAQDVAVLECSGLTLIGVAYQVLLAGECTWHEAPLQARGKARATA